MAAKRSAGWHDDDDDDDVDVDVELRDEKTHRRGMRSVLDITLDRCHIADPVWQDPFRSLRPPHRRLFRRVKRGREFVLPASPPSSIHLSLSLSLSFSLCLLRGAVCRGWNFFVPPHPTINFHADRIESN